MANGYNPYGIASTQQGLLESLLGSEQAQKTGALAFGQQKGEMSEEFQKEQIASQRKQKELLNQKRETKGFGGFLETIAPMLGLIPGVGTIAGATLAGLSGMYKAKQQSKFAQQQIEAAKGAGLDAGKWGGTFLGKESGRIAAGNESMLDDMLEATKVSGGDLFKTGLTEGIKGYAMGKMGEGIGKTFEGAKAGDVVVGKEAKLLKGAQKAGIDTQKLTESYGKSVGGGGGETFYDLDPTKSGDSFSGLSDELGISSDELFKQLQGLEGKQTFTQSLFGEEGAFAQDPATLLGKGKQGSNILMNLLLLLTQMEGDR